MTTPRSTTAGVTLIEMLVALAVSSLIGLASFVFLDSVTRTEAGVAGRLDRLKHQNRAFQLWALDVENAQSAALDDALVLRVAGQTVTWQASASGLERVIAFPDRPLVKQVLLEEAALFRTQTPGILILELTDTDLWRQVLMPDGPPQ